MMSCPRPLCSGWQVSHFLPRTTADAWNPTPFAIRACRSLWSWQPRHLSFDSAFVLLTWHSLQPVWLASEPWLDDSAPGELEKKSACARAIVPWPSATTKTSSARALPGCTGPRDRDVGDGERGEEHGEGNVDL